MSKLAVNPTRMEMLKLKKRLKTAEQGHKLLKDKRDGLMKEFIQIIKEARQIRREIEPELQRAFEGFLFASASASPWKIEEALLVPRKKISLEADTKNVMGVNIPIFDYKEEDIPVAYSLTQTPSDLDEATETFSSVLRKMVNLAQIEHSAKLLAFEIEKTRRRVNALEYVFIPDIKETIKYIESKLTEQERSVLITLMKVKKQMTA
ncbi:MAG: V-type ATP synthase subunit D [Candidatus Nealsonbacteria bacterium]|nr:V-type ATP synthase subunit D [Candidatus Nealsonbacteria bacterium]